MRCDENSKIVSKNKPVILFRNNKRLHCLISNQVSYSDICKLDKKKFMLRVGSSTNKYFNVLKLCCS